MATPSRSRRDFAALEARRFQAARLFAKGESQGAVARALGVTPVTAHHWYHAWHANGRRSEEHTSELQSRLHLVCRLLLEKKKKRIASRVRFNGKENNNRNKNTEELVTYSLRITVYWQRQYAAW